MKPSNTARELAVIRTLHRLRITWSGARVSITDLSQEWTASVRLRMTDLHEGVRLMVESGALRLSTGADTPMVEVTEIGAAILEASRIEKGERLDRMRSRWALARARLRAPGRSGDRESRRRREDAVASA